MGNMQNCAVGIGSDDEGPISSRLAVKRKFDEVEDDEEALREEIRKYVKTYRSCVCRALGGTPDC